ncbi:cadherin-like domain-containing protein [Pseudomonas stutzeri]|nr:cadherin-like domain-containing protein [Stutzerimonas stutzeri]
MEVRRRRVGVAAVGGENDAPLANDDSLAATEDTPVTFSAADLLGNDSDVDGDSLSIASVTSPEPR